MIILAALAMMQDTAEAPVLEPGASLQFKEAVYRAQEHLAADEFAEAAKQADRLPQQKLTLSWDDAKVPAARRASFVTARDAAIKIWSGSVLGTQVEIVKGKADIMVSFAESLPVNPDNGLIQSSAFLVNYIPGEPVVDGIIALKRGEAQLSAEGIDITNEVAYAIGLYYGMDRQPQPSSIMFRTEGSSGRPNTLWPIDLRLCISNVKAGEMLRQAAAKKERMKVTKPRAFIDVRSLDGGTVMQGESMPMTFQVTNQGTAPLFFRIVPDCSCFILGYDGEVAPGSTSLVRVDINTYDFPGPLDKSLFIYTNDPELPVRQITAKGQVNHAYQFIRPGPSQLIHLDGGSVKETVYLVINEKADIGIEDISMAGTKGSIDAEPWAGMIADPATGAPATERKGYKLTLYLEPTQVTGRFPITITARTNSDQFPRLTYSVFAQHGIVSVPPSVYLGETEQQPVRAWFVLTRPGKPFKITSLESNSKHIKLSHEKIPNGDAKIIVEFDGKATIGNFSALVTVGTDDPLQPFIQVPIQGIVK